MLVALLALELFQHSRRHARADAQGELVLLSDQDRTRWHRPEIAEGVALLAGLANPPGIPAGPVPLSPLAATYAVQASIAAEHATAATAAATRWPAIVAHYDTLLELAPSPPARLARAVAVAEAYGAAAGLAALDELAADPVLAAGHRLPAVRAELLTRLGRVEQARAAYDSALATCTNEAKRAHLTRRRAVLPPD